MDCKRSGRTWIQTSFPAYLLTKHNKKRMARVFNFRMFRQSLGLSQEQMSSETGLPEAVITELENGKMQITDEMMAKLKERFGSDAVSQWVRVVPEVSQADESAGADYIPISVLNRMLDEFTELRKIAAKSQEQIDRLIGLLERRRRYDIIDE